MGNTFEHKTTESALKMPNQENNGKREINFSVVCIDLLGTGVYANEQQSSMKKNGVKLIFLKNKTSYGSLVLKLIILFHYYFANKSFCFLTTGTFRGGMM